MTTNLTSEAKNLIDKAKTIVVVQAENPDGDSLSSALALEDLLTNLGKEVSLYCPVDLPKYIRYLSGWDRVTNEFNYHADLAIIVDTASHILLSKALDNPVINNWLFSHPSITIDHHTDTEPSLSFASTIILKPAVATAEIIYDLAQEWGWQITRDCATFLFAGISSDTLGLTTPNITSNIFLIASKLIEAGAKPSQIEEARQALNKKAPEILDYKGDLLKRIEYHDDGRLATIHIPFDEIKQYSDQYNPSVLVLEEMRLVEGVEVAVAFKTYPDGKLTGKIRSNQPVASTIAGYFGGGGHAYASGFRVYDDYNTVLIDLIRETSKVLDEAKR